MKKIKITGYGLGVLLLALSSCNEGMEFQDGTGTISPLVSYDPTVITAKSSSSRAAEITDVTVDDLTLTLTSEDGSVNETFTVANFPKNREFNVGKYTLTASYGDSEAEGFELPAVYGEAELTVNEGKQTQVELTALPTKAMVSLTFDSSLTEYMTSVSARLHSEGGTYIDYSATETRPVYLKPGTVTLSVDFVKPNGKGGTLVVNEFDALAAHHYTANLTLGGEGAGTVDAITVTYDDLLESEEVNVDISDLVLTTPAPVVTPQGFTNDELFTIIEGDAITASPAFMINARGGISKAVLTTTGSLFLSQTGWPAEIDLAGASEADQARLTSLGFKDLGLFRNPGTIAGFDLSGVAGHIPASGLAADPVSFTLVVTDANGKQSEPLGFKIKVEELVLMFQADGDLYDTTSETLDVHMVYNGTNDLKSVLNVQYLKNTGAFAPATVVSAVPANGGRSRAADDLYVVTVRIPSDAKMPLTLKASLGSITTEEQEIPAAPLAAVNDLDVFATSAWVSASKPGSASAPSTIELYASTDGTNFSKAAGSKSGSEFHATGLSANTNYTVYALVDGEESNRVTFKTEAATQIENSNLDNGWSTTDKGSHNMVNTPSPWASLNQLSAGSSSNGTNKYARPNSTESTTDAKSGTAALIRAVAYGFSGHTAGLYNTNNCTPGKLFLGTYDDQSGIAFGSRPSKLKFSYKYTNLVQSSETAYAEVKVLAADGSVIATGNRSLSAADSYQDVEIALSYARGAKKAAKIAVMFRSTADNVSGSQLHTPSKTLGVIQGCFFGSELRVDEISLAY